MIEIIVEIEGVYNSSAIPCEEIEFFVFEDDTEFISLFDFSIMCLLLKLNKILHIRIHDFQSECTELS